MNKKQIVGGLNGLISSATAPTQEQAATPEAKAPKTPTKTVCYALPVNVAENIKYIAYYDRKKLNAVVTEAFAEYIERWNNQEHKAEKARKL